MGKLRILIVEYEILIATELEKTSSTADLANMAGRPFRLASWTDGVDARAADALPPCQFSR
jgi:hypothetical protein